MNERNWWFFTVPLFGWKEVTKQLKSTRKWLGFEPVNYLGIKCILEKTEGAIKNEKFRDTDNIIKYKLQNKNKEEKKLGTKN